ncbi:MAG: glycoside hydrolase family 11 protein [Polyangiaceae bacterium]
MSFAQTGTSGPSYIGVCGVTTFPNVEFFIVEGWIGARRTNWGTKVGTITVDGAQSDVYKESRTGPTIAIDENWPERYFSLRQTPRQCGRVSVTDHFLAWKRLGLDLGKMHEVSVAAEGMGAKGTIDFTVARIDLD